MTVQRLLQIHVATMAALGTVLLGMGQRNPVLPMIAIFTAVTGVIFTDVLRWFWLNRTLGNLAALVAVLFSAFDFWNNTSDQQLLAIANLLVYLQIVLMYQQKSERRYWELVVLSLLQVVVAAALNLGFEFGVLLVVYMLTAFSALALFFVYREGRQFCATDDDTQPQLMVASQNKTRSLRRRLLGDPLVAEANIPAHTFAQSLVGWGFLRNISAMGLMTMIFTVVLFYSVPRMGNAVWQGAGGAGPTVGFSPEVKLDEVSEIRQSDQIVMRVTFRKPNSEQPITVAGEPYFSGTVLSVYENDNGVYRWRAAHTGKVSPLPRAPEGVPVVIQETVLAPANDNVLFTTPLAFAVEGTPREVRFDPRSGRYFRRTEYSGPLTRAYNYSLGTTAFRDNWQLPFIPHSNAQDRPETLVLSPAELQRTPAEQAEIRHTKWQTQLAELELEKVHLQRIDESRFPQLVATANRIASKTPPEEREVIARLLQDHFRTPGAYRYSLDFSKLKRDKSIDPIEDFVANHHTGHCEYFASALCLMLRSQGIPARIVVGYKGGEYNIVGGYYWVRQLHAHAWVEAYLEPDQVPPDVLPERLLSPKGAWMRLDPTPASDEHLAIGAGLTLMSRLGDAMDYAQLLWDDYVLGLNSERQRKSIYKPLAEQATSAIGSMFEPGSIQGLMDSLYEVLGIDMEDATRNPWFSWRAGLIAIVASSALILLYQAIVSVVRWFFARRTGQAQAGLRAQRQVVAFYQELEDLLAKLGIQRAKEQTQREFAASAGQRLALLGPDQASLTSLPSQVVDAFYRVRFGELPLTPEQASAIQASLHSLAQAVTSSTTEPQRRPRNNAAK